MKVDLHSFHANWSANVLVIFSVKNGMQMILVYSCCRGRIFLVLWKDQNYEYNNKLLLIIPLFGSVFICILTECFYRSAIKIYLLIMYVRILIVMPNCVRNPLPLIPNAVFGEYLKGHGIHWYLFFSFLAFNQ